MFIQKAQLILVCVCYSSVVISYHCSDSKDNYVAKVLLHMTTAYPLLQVSDFQFRQDEHYLYVVR